MMKNFKPRKPCNHPGCLVLISSGERFCERHAELKEKEHDKRRGSATSRGYDNGWRKLRAVKARMDPLCEVCLEEGLVTPLAIVHHVRGVDEFPELRLRLDNLKSLCRRHHDEVHEGGRWSEK
jgi:5-methylcytosine-specific restriction enzyme A